jgi:hypothetical protein
MPENNTVQQNRCSPCSAPLIACSKESCTRDAPLSTVVAWKQESLIYVLFLAPYSCRSFSRSILSGSHCKDFTEPIHFSMLFRVSSYGERLPWAAPMGWSEFRAFVLRSSILPSKLDPHPTHVVVGQTAKRRIDSYLGWAFGRQCGCGNRSRSGV